MIKMLPCIILIVMIPASLLSFAYGSDEIIEDKKHYTFMPEFYEFSEHNKYLENFYQTPCCKPVLKKPIKITEEKLPQASAPIQKQKNDLDNNDKKCTKRTRYQFEIWDREEILQPSNTAPKADQKEALIPELSTEAKAELQCPIKKSRSPVFDAFVFCILKEYGVKFTDRFNGKILFANALSYKLFINCIDIISKNISKKCSANAENRHVLISRYFDYLPSKAAMLTLRDELEVVFSAVYAPAINHKIEMLNAIGIKEDSVKRHKKSED